ncbi:MAG: alpha-hydroxy acid oxidase [Vulcanimicrobiaceae bacterium]
MKRVACIDDLRTIAQRRVPKAFFQYADAGSYSEATLHANRDDLEAIKFRQRVGIDLTSRELGTTILGEPASLPLVLGPIGALGMQHGDGEILACRAAQAAGIPFTLSTMSVCSIEDVAEAAEEPFWFQLYVMRDRGFVRDLIARAAAVKCSALVVTLDLTMLGQRHNDVRNGLSVPLELTLPNAIDVATKPSWLLSILYGKRKTFGNLHGRIKGMDDITSLSAWVSQQFDPSLNWKDLEWIRELWPGKIVLKGILEVEDAKIAAKSGASAIIVSNHGGRQLDGTTSSISALRPIVQAVGSEIEVMFDGGIRSGQDVLRALAFGARSCMIGRAFVYGLGAAGEEGVAKALEILRKELDVTMGLTGTHSIAEAGMHIIAKTGASS